MDNGFDELEILSQEDIIIEFMRRVLRSYAELSRRREVTQDFLKKLCSMNRETRIWYALWEAAGAQRFTDILHFAGCSRSKLTNVLQELLRLELVRMVGPRYQAISPAWLAHTESENSPPEIPLMGISVQEVK